MNNTYSIYFRMIYNVACWLVEGPNLPSERINGGYGPFSRRFCWTKVGNQGSLSFKNILRIWGKGWELQFIWIYFWCVILSFLSFVLSLSPVSFFFLEFLIYFILFVFLCSFVFCSSFLYSCPLLFLSFWFSVCMMILMLAKVMTLILWWVLAFWGFKMDAAN